MRAFLSFLAVFTLLALPAKAEGEVEAVEAYLSNLRTLQGHFVQTDNMGHALTGRFYLKRPGKMRFEYDAPVTDFIVADGRFIYYYDGQMKQQSNALISQSLADFFLRKDLKLSGDLSASDVKRVDGLLEMTLTQTSNPNAGQLTLGLTEEPMQLKKWTIVDAQGAVTRVELSDVETGIKLGNEMFRYYDPEKKNEKYN